MFKKKLLEMLSFSSQTCITSTHVLLIAHENFKCYNQEVTSNSNHSACIHEKTMCMLEVRYRGADKSLVRPGRKQAQKHVRDPCDFDNIET